MKNMHKIILVGLAIVFLLAGAAFGLEQRAVQAQGNYEISWWTVDGSGSAIAGGSYELSGTAGQPDAGALSSSSYTLESGFWRGAPVIAPYQMYLPLAVRNAG